MKTFLSILLIIVGGILFVGGCHFGEVWSIVYGLMFGINFKTELQEKAKNLAAELYHLGFNIDTVVTFPKGTRILFKTLQEDRVTFTHYFNPPDYNSGVQLSFTHVDGKLTFKRKGVFGFRDDKYDTPENNKTLETLIKIVEANTL